MKHIKILLVAIFLSSLLMPVFAQNQKTMAEFSLFYEYHKNKDYESALPHGWKVVNTDPAPFVRYKIFPKMEDILFYMHDSVATTDQEKAQIADTTLYLYKKALKYDPERKGYYLVRRAYVLETWENADPDTVIAAYEKAFKVDPNADTYYKDRLGQYLADHASDNNDYKLRALELYTKLSEQEPDNATWVSRIEALAENADELVDITYKAWQMDRENLEKAWKFASLAMRNKNYDRAIEALEFLVDKSPDVINYWNQLAKAYQKENMTDKAIKAYKKLIELQPDNADHYVNLALMYKNLDQFSVARSYLQKAQSLRPDWDYPVYIEGTLYEQSARNCGFQFMDKCVYQLAVDTYRKAAALGGTYKTTASERVQALANSVPSKEDYFFRKLNPGETIKIEGKCYDWINRSIVVPGK